MTTPEQVPVEPYKPAVSLSVRRAVYFAALCVGILSLLVIGLVEIWEPDNGDQIKATAELVVSILATAAGALGVAYTRFKNQVSP